MNSVSKSLCFAAVLVAGGVQATAQTVDVQAELASQRARIAELEKKASPAPSAGPLQFPEGLTPYVLIDLTLVGKSNATADGRTKIDFNEPFFSGNRWGLKGLLKTNVANLDIIYKLESATPGSASAARPSASSPSAARTPWPATSPSSTAIPSTTPK